MSGASLHEEIRGLVARVAPVDAVEDGHRRQALAWLDSTSDVFRRVKPGRPSPHLVSYFLLIDHGQGSVLLVDHRKAGLWLPTGGHVEPGEHPAATVRREVREELGIEAVFSPVTGESPMFVTVTATAPAAGCTPTSACGLCSPAAQLSSWHPTLMSSAQRAGGPEPGSAAPTPRSSILI